MKYLDYRAALALSSLAAAAPLSADVTIEQTLDVTAPGALSLAAMEGKTTTAISGGRSRTDNDLQFKSSVMRTFGGDIGQSSEIVRLDDELIYSLNHKERQYTRTTFEALRAQMAQAIEQIEQSQAGAGEGGGEGAGDGSDPDTAGGSTDLPVDEQSCEWSESSVNVDRTGQRASIAGMEAEQTRIVATQTCRDPETGKACDLTWTLDNWLAPDVPGGAEAIEFWQSYAQKLGYEDLASNPGLPAMAALFSQYEAGWEEIEKQSDDMQGYPLRTVMSLAIGGKECTTDSGEPLSYESVYGESMQQAMGETAAQSVGESVGGSIGGAVAKGLFGAFGKKKKEPEAAPAQDAPVGSITLFKVVSETSSIDTGSVPGDRFDVPAGYTEVAAQP